MTPSPSPERDEAVEAMTAALDYEFEPCPQGNTDLALSLIEFLASRGWHLRKEDEG